MRNNGIISPHLWYLTVTVANLMRRLMRIHSWACGWGAMSTLGHVSGPTLLNRHFINSTSVVIGFLIVNTGPASPGISSVLAGCNARKWVTMRSTTSWLRSKKDAIVFVMNIGW